MNEPTNHAVDRFWCHQSFHFDQFDRLGVSRYRVCNRRQERAIPDLHDGSTGVALLTGFIISVDVGNTSLLEMFRYGRTQGLIKL
jgi:hypothetical protein